MHKIEQEVSKLTERLRQVLFFSKEDTNIDFYISSLTEYNPLHSTEEIKQWLLNINKDQYFNVTEISLNDMRKWNFDKSTGDLKHDSGGFFSIKGLQIETNLGSIPSWTQPIIHQPEIGILGIITKKIHGIVYFLLQAKAEPGNINTYQLSPTVQATRSNYLQLHGGKVTKYLKYFMGDSNSEILLDQLQSEQGARFYHKRNRNIIIRIPADYDLELSGNYRWLTLGQINRLTQYNNTVNMDTRSVIGSISYEPEYITCKTPINEDDLQNCLSGFTFISKSNFEYGVKLMISSHPNSGALHTFDQILRKIARRKFECELNTKLISLNEVNIWKRTPREIFHPERKFFSVIGVRIEAMNREVSSWDQPIIKQDHPGLIGFIIKEINGVLHFLMQLKFECGVMDLLEISPTVQCITCNYEDYVMPTYVDEMVHQTRSKILSEVFQSEEGGRFYRESNENIILLVDQTFQPEDDQNFIWMTMSQIKHFIKFNNFMNVEARSLLACLPTT